MWSRIELSGYVCEVALCSLGVDVAKRHCPVVVWWVPCWAVLLVVVSFSISCLSIAAVFATSST